MHTHKWRKYLQVKFDATVPIMPHVLLGRFKRQILFGIHCHLEVHIRNYGHNLLHWDRITTEFQFFGLHMPIPVAARSKVWACGLSLAGIAGSNPAGGMDFCLL